MPHTDHIEAIELRSDEVKDILSQMPSGIIRWGNILFLVLLLLLLGISWFVKYPDIITSPAILTTEIPPQKEIARISGKLEHILVKDKELVVENQVLAVIENTANYQDILLLKSVIDTIKVTANGHVDDFYFPLDSLPILFLGEIESDFALFENAYIQYKLNKELQPFSNESIANKYSVRELQNQLVNLEAQKGLNQKELAFKETDLTRQKTLFERGVISAQEYERQQLDYLQAERNFKSMNSSISQTRNAISSAQKTSKGTEINSAKEDVILLKTVIQSFNQLKKSIKSWELMYLFKSNMTGKVSFLNVWNENQTVNQGEQVFVIIPTLDTKYIAKLKTPALNSGKIKINQLVHIKLQNYPETEFGMLKGVVKSISLTPDKEGNYLIDVSLPSKLITSYNIEIQFQQEMSGTAEIITEDLRLLERFFYQFKKILQR